MRGRIGETPWGWTLGELGTAQRTVQLTLRSDDHIYRIAFDRGSVVAATSPLAVDAITRIALTNHFIAKAQVNEIKRRLDASPGLDDVDVLALAANLTPEQTQALRIRAITQRAARTFAVDIGEFETEDALPAPTETAIDVRAVIYMGARRNLREDRLRFGLRQLASRFTLKPEASVDGYNFTREEQPLLASLRSPTSFAELEANHRDIDPRAVQAVVYALASCNALVELDLAPTRSESGLLEMSVAQGTPQIDAIPDFDDGPLTRAITSLQREELGHDRSLMDTFMTGRVTCVRPNALTAHDVVALIKERAALVARGADHFTLLGVPIGAPIEDVHAAYVELSRHLDQKRLAELGIIDKTLVAETVLAQVGIAFTVLTDRIRRNEYLATLRAKR